MLVIYIVYSRRSCVSGRALFLHMKKKYPQHDVRRISREGVRPAKRADLVIRWGNSFTEFRNARKVINANVSNASRKIRMITTLRDADVSIPSLVTSAELRGFDGLVDHELLDDNSKMFCRSRSGVVEYRHPVVSDQYATKNVEKVREFRVHVINGKTVGVYQKVLQTFDRGDYYEAVLKDENSLFRRLDMADDDVRKSVKGVRPAAKLAVKALGLDFGGVDVMMDKDGKVYVNEVNSSPGLNSLNVERYCDEFMKEVM